jgi:hypothetical protein
LRLPNFTLYRHLGELYSDFLALQRQYMQEGLREQAQSRIDALLRLEELERYGALLTRYPLLIEYLAIEAGRR